MQKTNIAPEILQPFFESAANAAQKGQSQYPTPLEFGRKLAGPLPAVRPTIVDLNCGAGHLLQASAGTDTATLLGADIDPCRGQAAGNKPKTPWNLWLAGGTIHTALSLFEKHSQKIDKGQVKRLFNLTGKTPMDLVIQRNTRDELLEVAERSGWRVQPELLAAVRAAIQQYHSGRAPLYPLPEIQRLGYLDEEDTIDCKADLTDARGKIIFRKGERYPLRSETVSFSRTVTRPSNFTGEDEELLYSGQELAFLISATDESEWCFMDAWLRDDPATTVGNAKRVKGNSNNGKAVDFTLQDLVAHFAIPEVPDVAAVQPDAYSVMVSQLSEIEAVLA